MLRFDTVVVSDLHLGARNSRASDFLRFLDALTADRLIIAGDLFESPQLHGLATPHVRVLEVLRQFARQDKLVWLRGNHDPDAAWCRDVLDLPSQDEIVLAAGERDYLVCHGHEWDQTMLWPQAVVSAADSVYHLAQRIDPSHRLARCLKRRTKVFCRAVEGLRREATAAARRRKMAGVIVGHSHVAGDEFIGGLHFLNCGCWTEQPTGFVGIRDDSVQQFAWQAPTRVCLTTRGPNARTAGSSGVPRLAPSGAGG